MHVNIQHQISLVVSGMNLLPSLMGYDRHHTTSSSGKFVWIRDRRISQQTSRYTINKDLQNWQTQILAHLHPCRKAQIKHKNSDIHSISKQNLFYISLSWRSLVVLILTLTHYLHTLDNILQSVSACIISKTCAKLVGNLYVTDWIKWTYTQDTDLPSN